MAIADVYIAEIDQEAVATRRMLERVPQDKLSWTPHPKSMSIGKLAWHIASVPRAVTRILGEGKFDIANARPAPQPEAGADFVAEFDKNLATVKEAIRQYDDAAMKDIIPFSRGEQVLREVKRAGIIRSVLMNHMVHHRGQLTVYLRLLDIPVPAAYGTSADE